MTFAAIVVLGYLLGSCPWGYWLVRVFRGEDIRTVGQRQHRGHERLARLRARARAFRSSSSTSLKGFVPAFLGVQLVSPLCGILAGAAAMAGHWRPLFLGFQKGGKMVATGGGVFFGVAPCVAARGRDRLARRLRVTRYTSVASIASALSLPVWRARCSATRRR